MQSTRPPAAHRIRTTLARGAAPATAAVLVLVLAGFTWHGLMTAQRGESDCVPEAAAPSPGPTILPPLQDAPMAPFPEAGDDVAPSLGKFRIAVAPRFRPLLEGMPGYDPATGNLDSPVLYDGETTIGRSAPLVNGSAEDEAGVPVGSAGVLVSDRDFRIRPDPASFPDVPGAREVHTAIKRFALKGGVGGLPVVQVRAGTDFPGLPLSAGEVRSRSSGGNAAGDLPAMSFFNIYVEVDLPPNPTQPQAFPGATLHNLKPLLLQNDAIDNLPPRVIYTHEDPLAVPILFASDNGKAWSAGEMLGHLTLAGHGVCYRNTPGDVARLEQTLKLQVENPKPLPNPLHLPMLLTERCDVATRFVDVALVIDTSSSMAGEPIAAARAATLAMVRAARLDRGDRIAVVTFHGDARLALPLTRDRERAEDSIRSLEVTGTGTAIDAALRQATAELTDPGHRSPNAPLIVLLTDGRQGGGAASALAAADAARAKGVTLSAIGLGPDVDLVTLRAIAGSDDRFFQSPTPAATQRIYFELAQDLLCPSRRFWPRGR